MSKLTCCLLVFAIALGAAPLAAQSSAPAEQGVLQAGDSVRVSVWRKPELSGQFVVAADGSIAHPLYREIRVAGVPQAEVEARVRTFLQRFESAPQVLVEPLLRVAVGGEVRGPRLYSVLPGTTIAQAVALAGGLTEQAHPRRATLRRGTESLEVDLTRPNEGLAASPVRSGDQVVVARRAAPTRDYVVLGASVFSAIVTVINLFRS